MQFQKKAAAQKGNAFHHRREQSANPYISGAAANQKANLVRANQNFNQYQNQVEQYQRKASEEPTRNSRWKPEGKKQQKSQESLNSIDEGHQKAAPII